MAAGWCWYPTRMSETRRRWLKTATWTTLLCAATYLLLTMVPVKLYIASSMAWIQANPTMGAMLLPLILGVGIPLCIPSPGFEILAGSMFGIVTGTLLCVVGKTIGQLIAFLAAKHLGRDRVNSYMQSNFPTFAALATVLQSSSWKPLLLIQVANVPHLVKCYGLAIADISTYRFAVSSAVGGLPYAVLWAYLGHHSKNLVGGSDDDAVELNETSFRHRMVIGVGGTVFTVLGMWWLVVYTKKQLHSEMQRVKHLHRCSEDSDDTCITISSSDDDDEVLQIGLLRPETFPTALTAAQPRSYDDI
ncbi:hypothetical protein PF010_g1317 [Phytophthora fragariae]|uniref:VTT domain-containing protein n=1 Tax=Phytophthora fragariae TaxID=53985 RepID=A0A6A3M6P8_9STRA|nr:hypothetical protein PF011_g2748 [Phytophthora fragariae]KAE9137463.1 hypothetical protein PF010_g1317 [Phytophthora fragariae]